MKYLLEEKLLIFCIFITIKVLESTVVEAADAFSKGVKNW